LNERLFPVTSRVGRYLTGFLLPPPFYNARETDLFNAQFPPSSEQTGVHEWVTLVPKLPPCLLPVFCSPALPDPSTNLVKCGDKPRFSRICYVESRVPCIVLFLQCAHLWVTVFCTPWKPFPFPLLVSRPFTSELHVGSSLVFNYDDTKTPTPLPLIFPPSSPDPHFILDPILSTRSRPPCAILQAFPLLLNSSDPALRFQPFPFFPTV